MHDVRESKSLPARPCQDRATLIENLANALLNYEGMCQACESVWPIFEAYKDTTLTYLGLVKNAFMFLRRKEIAPQNQFLQRLSRKTVNEAFEIVERLVNDLYQEDYARAGYPTTTISTPPMKRFLRRFQITLITKLHDAFRQYGPQKYPALAIYHAIAAILLPVDVEHGESLKIAIRIQKRVKRQVKLLH
jgi:hypothetical protein